MKIKQVTFKNFAAIKNAMGANKITIDFTTAKNKICLIIGRNGSGKTTILSMLHPFADIGNLDVRNGNDYILKGKDGFKEIIIDDRGTEYIIQHYFSPHEGKSHSVKSYIKKNGVELNENGNVSSFKEYVKEELQIEPEYLKLIRLGSNVTNLINLSATERKNFMSKILEEVGVYLEYYKSVNAKLRELNSIISHDEDRMTRLNIIDISLFKDEIKDLEEKKEIADKKHLEITNKIAIHMDAIKDITDYDELKEQMHTLRRKVKKLNDVKERSGKVKELSFYEKEIDRLETENVVFDEKIKLSTEFVTKSLDQLDSMMDRKRNYEIKAANEKNVAKEIDMMNDNLTTLRLRMRNYEDNIPPHMLEDGYVVEDAMALISTMKKIDEILETTYSVGKEPIKKVIELIKDGENVQSYIDKHKIASDERFGNQDTLFLAQIMHIITNNSDTVIACPNECVAKDLFVRMKNILENSEVKDNVNDSQFYTDMDIAYHNISLVINLLKQHKIFFDKYESYLKKYFTTSAVFSSLQKLSKICPDEVFNDFISDVRDLDEYYKVIKEYSTAEENLNKIISLTSSNDASKELDNIDAEIESLRNDISSTRDDIKGYQSSILENGRTLETYIDIKEMVSEFDSTKELYENIEARCNDYETHQIAIKELASEDTSYIVQTEMLSADIQEHKSKLALYKDLKKQIKRYHNIYDDMVLVKEALSSKEGIPLHFITNYLGNVEETTNELLDIIYKGETYIDNFVITPTEFSIPFFHNGVRLSDVKYASQGELSFLSLALSFALSSQAIGHYNIMLWDEIDGVLDSANREKFIQVLENQIDRVCSEQNFLITHNNMFSSYPVDILDLSFENDTETYPLANYIEIERK